MKEVTRLDKIKVLTENELSFLVDHWGTDHVEPKEVVEWFAKGGFTTNTDEKINDLYQRLTAE